MHNFQPGDKVLYVPLHCQDDLTAKDVEVGVVSETLVRTDEENYVFVHFDIGGSAKFTPVRLLRPYIELGENALAESTKLYETQEVDYEEVESIQFENRTLSFEEHEAARKAAQEQEFLKDVLALGEHTFPIPDFPKKVGGTKKQYTDRLKRKFPTLKFK